MADVVTAVEMFAGAGGVATGFHAAGINVLAAAERWDSAADSYEANHPYTPVHRIDLADERSTYETLGEYTPDIVIGGPPCQDFSVMNQNKAAATQQTNKTALTVIYARSAVRLKPRIIIMENVPNSENHRAYWAALDVFAASGYGVSRTVLAAQQYGNATMRKRLITVAVKNAPFGYYEGFLHEGPNRVSEFMTPERLGHSSPSGFFFEYVLHPPPWPTVRRLDQPASAVVGADWLYFSQIALALKPSATLPRILSDLQNRDLRPENVAALSDNDVKRIAGFPTNYVLKGGPSARRQQVSNAVPPELSKHIGERAISILNEM
jgi:DNA (cytosine-5)-methyltransferase 1